MGPDRLTITINLPNLRVQGHLVIYVQRTSLSSLHAFADFLCALKRPTSYTMLMAYSSIQMMAHTDTDLNTLVTKKSQAGLYHEACSKEECFPSVFLASAHFKTLMLPYLGDTVKLENRLCILSIGVIRIA